MYSKNIRKTLENRLALPSEVIDCIESTLISEGAVSIRIQRKNNKLLFKTNDGFGWFRIGSLVKRFAYVCESCEKWFAYSPDDYKVILYSSSLGRDKEFNICPNCTGEAVDKKMEAFDAGEVEYSDVFGKASYFR